MNGGYSVTSDQNGVGAGLLIEQAQWYAIRTRSRHEKMVSDQLERQGIENFLPLVKHSRQWSDRVKEVELPLFSGNAMEFELMAPGAVNTCLPACQCEQLLELLAISCW